MKNSSLTLRLVILIFTSLRLIGAQPSTRTVEGVVMDQHSHPLAHAAVQIENEQTLIIRSYITQADGKYHFAGLNGDIDYELSAEYHGLHSGVRNLSKFDSREEPKLDLRIRFGK